jgi:type IV pilus assembly protein PilC
MPVFIWEGKDANNKVQKGEIEAQDKAAVRSNLIRQRITPSKIKPKAKDLFENISFMQPKVSQTDVIIFCRQFSTMIDAGLPIIQCLEILYTQQENPTFKKILQDIRASVEGGTTFSQALEKHPDVFDNLFVNMIAAGEAGGILDTILGRLSFSMEKTARLKKEIKGAMMLPIITICIAVGIAGGMLVFIIPVFADMFEGMGGALPLPTQIAITLSDFLRGNMHYIIIAGGLIVYAYRRLAKTEKGLILIDSTKLKLPVLGELLRKANVAGFTRTMGTMLQSGVGILEALEVTAKTAGNVVIEREVYAVRSGIAEGRTMADPLSESGVFPPMVCQMIAVGESTGAMDIMLTKIAEFYDEEVDQAVSNMKSLIEPVMTVVLGVIVASIAVAMYLPIFKMGDALG